MFEFLYTYFLILHENLEFFFSQVYVFLSTNPWVPFLLIPLRFSYYLFVFVGIAIKIKERREFLKECRSKLKQKQVNKLDKKKFLVVRKTSRDTIRGFRKVTLFVIKDKREGE